MRNEGVNKMELQDKITPDTLKTEYINSDEFEFYVGKNGFLAAKCGDKEYKRVILTRALPLSNEWKYISVSDVDKNEIGIIEDVKTFSSEQQKMIAEELSKRYFIPVITAIEKVQEKMGHFYFDVKIGDYKKSFTVKDITKSVRYHGKGFDIIDVDGNRFRVMDYESVKGKARKKLDAYLF